MSRRALVSGAHGFLGRHLARRLAHAGWQVAGLGHGTWSRQQWSEWGLEEWHAADVALDALITYGGESEVIFHCAGSGSVGFSMTHPYQDFQRTTQTTIAVLEYARLYAPQARIVLPSSAAVYGLADQLPIVETAPIAPASPYGLHKRLAEELCLSYASQYALRVAIVRLFSIYGVGLRKQLLWDACRKLSQGDATFAGTGDERRDWINVVDAVELMRIAGERAAPDCPIVNGGSGHSATVREVLQTLQHALTGSLQISFSGSRRQGDPQHFEADIARAQAWGWHPTIELESGIAEYVAWFNTGAL